LVQTGSKNGTKQRIPWTKDSSATKKTQQRLTSADRRLFKSIVAMKDTDNNDVRSYHAALDGSKLVIRGERSRRLNSGESKMLPLFFLLLPRKFRVDVRAFAIR
jgi:hypothetical protein